MNSQGQPSNNSGMGGGMGGGTGAAQMPEYLKNVSPEMINFGLHAGQDILKKQKERLMPGVSGFLSSLRYYFAVSLSSLIARKF